jgi:hypothetical protein
VALEPEQGRWRSAVAARDLKAAQDALQPYVGKIEKLAVDQPLVDKKLRKLDALLRQSSSRLAQDQYNPLQTSYLDLRAHLADTRDPAALEQLAREASALEKKLRAALKHTE